MICPRCNNNIQEGACYCTQCGLSVQTYQNEQQNQATQQTNTIPPTPWLNANEPLQRTRLIGNGIFAVYLFYLTFVYFTSATTVFFGSLGADMLYGIIYAFVSLVVGGLALLAGILLWKRKIAGLVISFIYNGLSILSSILINIGGIYLTYIGITGTSEYDVLGLVFGIPMLLVGLFMFAFSVFFVIYYIIKRKHFH